MAKPDFPALLIPGIHRISEQDVFDRAVKPFPGFTDRPLLFALFQAWVASLRRLGITGTLWLDGSFLTEKPNPSDIDLVLWSPALSRNLNAIEQSAAQMLLDHALGEDAL